MKSPGILPLVFLAIWLLKNDKGEFCKKLMLWPIAERHFMMKG